MKRVVANIEKEFRHVLNLNKQKEVNFKFNMSCLTMLQCHTTIWRVLIKQAIFIFKGHSPP